MEVVSLTPELKAQLDEYAQRHGQEPEAALVDILAAALEWDRHEYDETVQGALEAYEDVKAGRTQPADEFLSELRVKHGFPH